MLYAIYLKLLYSVYFNAQKYTFPTKLQNLFLLYVKTDRVFIRVYLYLIDTATIIQLYHL